MKGSPRNEGERAPAAAPPPFSMIVLDVGGRGIGCTSRVVQNLGSAKVEEIAPRAGCRCFRVTAVAREMPAA